MQPTFVAERRVGADNANAVKSLLVVLSGLVVAACVLIFAAWYGVTHFPVGGPKSQWVMIHDPTQPTNLLVVTDYMSSSFGFHLRGHIDGEADISVVPPDMTRGWSEFSNHLASGYVDWAKGGDYFSTGAVFRYRPLNVKTGVLIIEYYLY